MRRRGALLMCLLVVLPACPWVANDPRPTAAPPSTSTTSTTRPPPRLPPPPPYVAPATEVEPEVKQLAAQTVQLLTTYQASASTIDAARQRLVAAGAPPEIADKAGQVVVGGAASAGDIVYPQLAGFTTGRAAVMVVVRQRLLVDRTISAVTRTVDVRLLRSPAGWAVEDVVSFGGDPVAEPPDLSPLARKVVTHPRIQLPDSARWDIFAGRIDDRVLSVMANLADRYDIGVAVLSAGHPLQVFGTVRASNHIAGRAVDVWSINGPVVAQRATGALRPLVSELLASGVTELGSPLDVDGAARASFTDLVHQDHLHLGFRTR